MSAATTPCGARRALLLAAAALPLAAAPARAQEAELTGYVEAEQFSYFERHDSAGRLGRNQGLVQLEPRLSFGDRARLFAAVELRGDQADRDRDRVYLEEGYADLVWKRFDVRLGKQVIAWGKADVLNPTDQLSPADFSDPLDAEDEKIGVVAARTRVDLGRGAQWEGVVAPIFQESRIPTLGSRWGIPLPLRVPHPMDPGQTALVSYRIGDSAEPAATWRNAQLATRLSGTVRGWDVSVSYFDGWDHMPWMSREITPTGAASLSVRLNPEYRRKRSVGGDLATVVGPYTLRAEGAYLMPDPETGPDYAQYVLGVERTFGDLMGAGGTLVLLQWMHELAPDSFVPDPFDLRHLFQKSVTGRVQYNVTALAQVVVDGLYDLETDGYYVQPGASYQLGDHLRLEARVDLLGGSRSHFFGAFEENKRLQTLVRYRF